MWIRRSIKGALVLLIIGLTSASSMQLASAGYAPTTYTGACSGAGSNGGGDGTVFVISTMYAVPHYINQPAGTDSYTAVCWQLNDPSPYSCSTAAYCGGGSLTIGDPNTTSPGKTVSASLASSNAKIKWNLARTGAEGTQPSLCGTSVCNVPTVYINGATQAQLGDYALAVLAKRQDPTSEQGLTDNFDAAFGNSVAFPLVSPVVANVMSAYRSQSTISQVDDTIQFQIDWVENVHDQLLVAPVETASKPQVDRANAELDYVEQNTNRGAGFFAENSSYTDEENWQEKRVCGRYWRSCKRSRHSSRDAEKWRYMYFPEQGNDNGPGNAFKHCVWSALMTKRQTQPAFAKAMGDAHEYGNPRNTVPQRDMDLHNNSIGRQVGAEGAGQSDRWLANRCEYYVFAGVTQNHL